MQLKLIILILLTLAPPPYISVSTYDFSVDMATAVLRDQSRDYVVEYNLEGPRRLYDIEIDGDQIWFTEYNVSKLWKFDTKTEELTAVNFPEDITPLFVKRANDGSLWFLDYDFLPQNETDYVVRFNPNDGNTTMFELPQLAHAINFEISGKFAIVTILNQDLIMLINTETFEFDFIEISCEVRCGPSGEDFDSQGNLWISDNLGNQYIQYSPISQNFTFYSLPNDFRAPAYLKIDRFDTLWLGSHGGDRLININHTDYSALQYVSPQPDEDQYPTSGINDIEFAQNDDIWFAEHFINRVGRIHRLSQTLHEYFIPRKNPLTAMIQIEDDKLWFPDDYGIIGYYDLNLVPTISIGTLSNQTINEEPVVSLSLNVSYLTGVYDEIEFTIFGEVRNFKQFKVISDRSSYKLGKGHSNQYNLSIYIDGKTAAGTFMFVLGIKGNSFSATQNFYLHVSQDWDLSSDDMGFDYQYPLIGFMLLVVLFAYRKEISKLVSKLRHRKKE